MIIDKYTVLRHVAFKPSNFHHPGSLYTAVPEKFHPTAVVVVGPLMEGLAVNKRTGQSKQSALRATTIISNEMPSLGLLVLCFHSASMLSRMPLCDNFSFLLVGLRVSWAIVPCSSQPLSVDRAMVMSRGTV
mgnify:CR=1 FL=1